MWCVKGTNVSWVMSLTSLAFHVKQRYKVTLICIFTLFCLFALEMCKVQWLCCIYLSNCSYTSKLNSNAVTFQCLLSRILIFFLTLTFWILFLSVYASQVTLGLFLFPSLSWKHCTIETTYLSCNYLYFLMILYSWRTFFTWLIQVSFSFSVMKVHF